MAKSSSIDKMVETIAELESNTILTKTIAALTTQLKEATKALKQTTGGRDADTGTSK